MLGYSNLRPAIRGSSMLSKKIQLIEADESSYASREVIFSKLEQVMIVRD